MTANTSGEPAADTVLAVHSLSKRFGALNAVDGVSFDLAAGELLGIAGPNGAGKTTLFSLLAKSGIVADTGDVALCGRSLRHSSAAQIAARGLRRTFQRPEIFPSLTVAETMSLAARFLGSGVSARDHVDRALDRTGLFGKHHVRGGELSLVDRKRLMIATAIVGQPLVLLLDEPAGGLSLDEQEQLIGTIAGINRDGVAIVLIEHVLPLLRRLATRLMVLAEGRVLAEGHPDEVFRRSDVVEAYLG